MAKTKTKTPAAAFVVTRSGRERFLTDHEVAAWLGVTTSTLSIWRCTKRYPLNYVRVGRLIRYRESDVLQFVESRMVSPIALAAAL